MDWQEYFLRNGEDRFPIPWEAGVHIGPSLRAPLIRSLQRFQIGESGDGAHLKSGAAQTDEAGYCEAITLFVAEEQEHSRLLGRLLQMLDAPLLGWHWSDFLFTRLRRLMGLHLELLVLLIAEVIAKRYYRAVDEGTDDPVLKAVCAQIRHDEEGHLAFHCDRLNRALGALSVPAALCVGTVWRVVFRLFCLGVIADHSGLLRAVGVPVSVFWRDCGHLFDGIAAHIFGPAPSAGRPTESARRPALSERR